MNGKGSRLSALGSRRINAAVAATVVVLGGLVATVTVGLLTRGHYAQVEENRAIALSRALAYVAARRSPAETAAFIDTLDDTLGSQLLEAYVLGTGEVDRYGLSTGNRYLANLYPDLVGVDLLGHEDERQKDIFDRAETVIANVPGHEARLQSAAGEALARSAPFITIDSELSYSNQEALNVNVPVVTVGGDLTGVAGVSVVHQMASPSWPLVLLGFAVFVGIALLLVGPRAPPIALVGAVAATLIALVAVGAGWDASARTTMSEGFAPEARVVLGAAVDTTDDGAVAYSLRDYRDGRIAQLEAFPFQAPDERELGGAMTAVAVALLVLGLAMLALARFLASTYRHLLTDPWAYIYVIPAMIGMALLVFLPFTFGIGLAFTERDAGRFVPVGFKHFASIFSGESSSAVSVYWTLFVTLLWTGVNVILHLSIGLALALVLNDTKLKFKKLYRVLLILPWAIPNYITALIWRGMFDNEEGMVNALLVGVGFERVNWLTGSFGSAFTANLITNVWLGFPFMMVVALGALQSIPGGLYEAAEVDGASRWQQFRAITLPLLKPALFPAVVLGTIWTFNMFNVIYLVSGGGPDHSTEILITEAYKAFWVLGRWGYAAAYSVVIFLILLTLSWGLNRMSKATEGAFE